MPATVYPAPGPDGQVCRLCKYYQLKKPGAGFGTNVGICRRYPPPVAHGNGDAMVDAFAQVRASDWCGEYIAS